MENPTFALDANETGRVADPEQTAHVDSIETDIPLEKGAEEAPQALKEKPQTGWRKESNARLSRELTPGNKTPNLNSGDHRHKYILEDNLRKVSIGRCEGCGTEREFKNHIEDILGYTPSF